MAVNQATIAALLPRPISPDLACDVTEQQLAVIADHLQVVGLASQITSPTGVSVPATNNTGAQALTLAQELQTQLNALSARIPQRRTVAIRQSMIDGDGVMDFTFSPALPDTNYMVHVNLMGGTGNPANYFAWRVVSGSQTVSSFQLKFQGLPDSTLASITVEQIL